MEFWIDESETMQEEYGKGKFIKYYRCGCKICEKCWFRPDREFCLYSGPYIGYEDEKAE